MPTSDSACGIQFSRSIQVHPLPAGEVQTRPATHSRAPCSVVALASGVGLAGGVGEAAAEEFEVGDHAVAGGDAAFVDPADGVAEDAAGVADHVADPLVGYGRAVPHGVADPLDGGLAVECDVDGDGGFEVGEALGAALDVDVAAHAHQHVEVGVVVVVAVAMNGVGGDGAGRSDASLLTIGWIGRRVGVVGAGEIERLGDREVFGVGEKVGGLVDGGCSDLLGLPGQAEVGDGESAVRVELDAQPGAGLLADHEDHAAGPWPVRDRVDHLARGAGGRSGR